MGRARCRSVHRRRHYRNRIYLAASLKRHLLITQRRIPLDSLERYASLWRELREQAERAGGRAWLFRAQNADGHFTEFVEWQDAASTLIEQGDVARAHKALNSAFHAIETGTWIEHRI